ncbi:MAG: ATP-binding cassette domain-containing protein [SAR324 cluster bacterium]|nr:ATP-binding cassette domain-containing protein [SAR324 cluster bacterium]
MKPNLFYLPMKDKELLVAEGVVREYLLPRQSLLSSRSRMRALDGVSLKLGKGESFGIVGESGCGKSTLARTVMGLEPPQNGRILFQGEDLYAISPEKLKSLRRGMQMVFQDPYGSLNPRHTIGRSIAEPLSLQENQRAEETSTLVGETLEEVGLEASDTSKYPHEFSGGQRQRIGIARALALNPDFIICDEPIAALDVSIQAQVVNLLEDLQDQLGLTYLFISHDLSMIRHIADRVAVMYLGVMVELASSKSLYGNPLHPYTQALLSAVPVHDPEKEQKRERIILQGDVPSPANPPSGCRFRTRCPIAESQCAEKIPEWREKNEGHWVACHKVS